MDSAEEDVSIIESATQRLMSGEYPESIAKDLRQHAHLLPELRELFEEASVEQKRRGKWRVIVGSVVSVLTLIGVLVALGAGCVITGPGLLLGLWVLTAGIIKLRNSRDILQSVHVLDTSTERDKS